MESRSFNIINANIISLDSNCPKPKSITINNGQIDNAVILLRIHPLDNINRWRDVVDKSKKRLELRLKPKYWVENNLEITFKTEFKAFFCSVFKIYSVVSKLLFNFFFLFISSKFFKFPRHIFKIKPLGTIL